MTDSKIDTVVPATPAVAPVVVPAPEHPKVAEPKVEGPQQVKA